jgi:hypothetical protein
MTISRFVAAISLITLVVVGTRSVHAQEVLVGPIQSKSTGFFLGAGLEGNSLTGPNGEKGGAVDSGRGGSLVLGYGFSPRWSLYAEGSVATMQTPASESYTLTHVDLGTRIHFRTGPHTVVPFLQLALCRRAIQIISDGLPATASGGGVSGGGGLNVHFSPNVAFSTALTWTVGNFDQRSPPGTAFSNITGESAVTARFYLGVIWFPQGS